MTRLVQSAALAAAESAVLAALAERLADNAMSLTLGKCSSNSRNISRTSSALSAEPGESLLSFSCLITNSVTQAPSRKLIKTEVTSCTCWTAVLKKIPTREACLTGHIFLWPPYEIGQAITFLPCGFYLLSIFFFFLT